MKGSKSFAFAYLRFFLIGLAIFVAVGAAGLFYLNNYYFSDNANYKSKVVATGASSKVALKTVTIDSNAKNLSVSFDRHYAAYLLDGKIGVADLTTGQKYTIDNPSKMTPMYFRWVYNRDWIAVAEKNSTDDYARLYTCSMKDRKLNEVRDNVSDTNIDISLNEGDSITEIEMSTAAVKTYVKITSSSKRSRIYEVDAYGDTKLTQLYNTAVKSIGAIQSMKEADKLLYEDSSAGKLYMYGRSSAISVDGVTSLGLLGFDNSDNVYLANLAGGTTRTIYRGAYSSSAGKWTWADPIKLDAAVPSTDIYVQLNGSIYYVDENNSTVVKAQLTSSSSSSESASSSASSSKTSSSSSKTSSAKTSSKSSSYGTPYKGKVVGVFQSGFITLYNNQLVPYEFKS
jgi:hypothetical protein